MAITTTCLYCGTNEEILKNIYDFFSATDYFDDVVLDSENSTVNCFVGDIEFIKFGFNTSGNMQITISNGTYSKEFQKPNYTFKQIKQCKHGLLLYDTKNETAFSLTRDNKDNLCAIITDQISIYTGQITATASTYAITPVPNSITGHFFYTNGSNGMTSMCPIVTNNPDGSYTPNAFLLTFCQNASDGILTINGIDYLSNGIWCIKDE